VHSLADKVAVVEDPALTARFPDAVPCRIEIRTRDGDVKTATLDYPRGHVKNPMTDAEVETKFRTLAGRMLSEARVESALRAIWALDEAGPASVALDPVCAEDGRGD
jgi:2-methylcitrate dehydratase